MGMRERCKNPNNPAYKDYGGRGIRVCKRWSSFANFLEDMGMPPPKYTLERDNNDGPYSKSNCRWATRKEQQNNRRSNRRIAVNKKTLTLTEWSEISGVHINTLAQRLDNGIPPERAIIPVRIPNKSKVTAADVRAIRMDTKQTLRSLALQYGVGISNICAIKSRRSWKHLPD
jgi:LysM repeat protein